MPRVSLFSFIPPSQRRDTFATAPPPSRGSVHLLLQEAANRASRPSYLRWSWGLQSCARSTLHTRRKRTEKTLAWEQPLSNRFVFFSCPVKPHCSMLSPHCPASVSRLKTIQNPKTERERCCTRRLRALKIASATRTLQRQPFCLRAVFCRLCV